MKYQITESDGKVKSISPEGVGWIVDKNSPLPEGIKHLTIGYDGKDISKVRVIYPSAQQWASMRSDEKSDLLELVDWTVQDVNQFVRKMEAMLPKNPRWMNA